MAAQQNSELSFSHSNYEHYPEKIPQYFADVYMDRYTSTSVLTNFDGFRPTFSHRAGAFTDVVDDHAPRLQKRSDKVDIRESAFVYQRTVDDSLHVGTSCIASQEWQDASASRASTNIARSLTPQPRSDVVQPILNPAERLDHPQSMTRILTVASVQITPAMRTQAEAFKNAVAELERTTDIKGVTDLMKGYMSFDSLLEDMKCLEQAYQDGDSRAGTTLRLRKKATDAKSTFGSKVRRLFRSMEKVAPGVNAWLQLLPTDSWEASAVVGGIRVVLKAAEVLRDIREDMYEVLARIPESLSRARALCEIYSKSPKIQNFTSDLYVTALKALGHMIEFYQGSRTKHALGALFKSGGYQSPMKECFHKLEIDEKTIFNEADTALHKQVLDNHSLLQTVRQDQCQQVLLSLEALRSLLKTGEMVHFLYREREIAKRKMTQEETEQRAESDRRKNCILDSIDYNPHQIEETRLKVLNQSITLSRVEQGYAMSMFESSNVQSWLKAPRSTTLVINAGQSPNARISSASLASYLIARVFDKSSDAVVITWFCGLCTSDQAVYDLVASIIGQLVNSESFSVDLATRWSPRLQRGLDCAGDLNHLLQAFYELLRLQLRKSPVYIIIDGVSFYDTWRLRSELLGVLEVIAGIAEDQSVTQRKPCKLLLTSPFSAKNLAEGMPGLDILHLSPNRYQDTSHLRLQDVQDFPGMKISSLS